MENATFVKRDAGEAIADEDRRCALVVCLGHVLLIIVATVLMFTSWNVVLVVVDVAFGASLGACFWIYHRDKSRRAKALRERAEAKAKITGRIYQEYTRRCRVYLVAVAKEEEKQTA